jgi:hypothetical protein
MKKKIIKIKQWLEQTCILPPYPSRPYDMLIRHIGSFTLLLKQFTNITCYPALPWDSIPLSVPSHRSGMSNFKQVGAGIVPYVSIHKLHYK